MDSRVPEEEVKRCPSCKQTIPSTLARVRHCGKCGKPIALHDKWYFHFDGKNVQMRHRQCSSPEHYLTEKQYRKKYGEARP